MKSRHLGLSVFLSLSLMTACDSPVVEEVPPVPQQNSGTPAAPETPATPKEPIATHPGGPGAPQPQPLPGWESVQFLGLSKEGLSDEAQVGLDHIYQGDGFHDGYPVALMPPARHDEAAVARDFKFFGLLPSPETRPAVGGNRPSLGQSVFARGGKAFVNSNCLACHAGVVSGTVVAGLGNAHMDQRAMTVQLLAMLKHANSSDRTELSEIEEAELDAFMDNAEQTLLTTFKFATSRGENYGPFAVWKIMSRLKDPANQGFITFAKHEVGPLDEWFAAQTLPTVDPNPWWLMKYKKTSYWIPDAGPYDASNFALNFTNIHPDVNMNREAHVETIGKILAFARETQAPKYPLGLDEGKVREGRQIFHGEKQLSVGGVVKCSACHGTYTKDPAFSNYAEAGGWFVKYSDSEMKDVNTNTAYSDLLRGFLPLEERINLTQEYFGKMGKPELAPKVRVPRANQKRYLPPPLVGVWASAPYFHNGSVPTIEQVLKSSSRPTLWRRVNDQPFAYDFSRVGLEHQSVNLDQYDQMKASAGMTGDPVADAPGTFTEGQLAVRAVYDTRRFGNGNSGHTFGDRLTESERASVIEFLKSLSGPNMPPVQ